MKMRKLAKSDLSRNQSVDFTGKERFHINIFYVKILICRVIYLRETIDGAFITIFPITVKDNVLGALLAGLFILVYLIKEITTCLPHLVLFYQQNKNP